MFVKYHIFKDEVDIAIDIDSGEKYSDVIDKIYIILIGLYQCPNVALSSVDHILKDLFYDNLIINDGCFTLDKSILITINKGYLIDNMESVLIRNLRDNGIEYSTAIIFDDDMEEK